MLLGIEFTAAWQPFTQPKQGAVSFQAGKLGASKHALRARGFAEAYGNGLGRGHGQGQGSNDCRPARPRTAASRTCGSGEFRS